jgi:hypothetical protein
LCFLNVNAQRTIFVIFRVFVFCVF